MCDEIGEYLDYVEFVEMVEDVQAPRKYIRDAENPIETYTDAQFKRRFRFSKETVLTVLVPLIEETSPASANNRGLPLAGLISMLIALRFYASGSFQLLYGDLFRVSQSTVCRTISSVSKILAAKVNKFVKFPSSLSDFEELKLQFYNKAGFPGVIGAVDGTHIPIKGPGNQQEVFRNRKGFFSLNVQIVAGPSEEILNIVARWPGSAHDARIFENSGVRVKLEEGLLPGHVLGDSGYPQRRYIYTPVPNPRNDSERHYNRSHVVTRSIVERTIGRLKRRFPCLYFELQNKIQNTMNIISACAVLYNIGIHAGDTWECDEEGGTRIIEVPVQAVQDNVRGNIIRQDFIERHFVF